jgi:hypothetical protein
VGKRVDGKKGNDEEEEREIGDMYSVVSINLMTRCFEIRLY